MNKYSKFLFQSNRASGDCRKISVIKPDLIKEFIKEISQDSDLGEEVALIIALSLSGGLRVSECLNIARRDCVYLDGIWRIKVRVLKKRSDTVEREFVLLPELGWLLKKMISRKRYNEYLFKDQSRFSIHHTLQRKLSLTPHSLRHSCVSFLMHKGFSDIQIASLLKMSVNNVRNYIHADSVSVFQKVWG